MSLPITKILPFPSNLCPKVFHPLQHSSIQCSSMHTKAYHPLQHSSIQSNSMHTKAVFPFEPFCWSEFECDYSPLPMSCWYPFTLYFLVANHGPFIFQGTCIFYLPMSLQMTQKKGSTTRRGYLYLLISLINGRCCAGGLPNMKSFRSFTDKRVALKELICTWNSHICAQTPKHCTELPCLLCYEVSKMILPSY